MFDGYREPSGEDSAALVSLYEKLISEHSSPFFDTEQYEQIVEFYLQSDQIKKARDVVEYALVQYPFATTLLLHYAHIKIYDNEIQEAFEIAEKVRLLEPSNPEVFVLLGNAYDEMGQYKMAIQEYEKALSFDSDKDDIYLYMAYSYENWDRYDKAIEVLKLALIQNPENQQALSELAFCCDFSDTEHNST